MFRTLVFICLITYGHTTFFPQNDLIGPDRRGHQRDPSPPIQPFNRGHHSRKSNRGRYNHRSHRIRPFNPVNPWPPILFFPTIQPVTEPLSPFCPLNEVWVDCATCQNTCATPDIEETCDQPCVPGCACIEGWFRNSNGACVPPENCDSCGPNEIFSPCGANSCVNTCNQPNLSLTCVPERCIAGCICANGLVRNSDLVCVDSRTCNISCGTNQFVNVCGDGCRRTCANKDEPLVCPFICRAPACSCRAEFVRGWNNECILPSQCPTCPGPNEYYTCGSACQTECATLGNPCNIISKKCVEGCFCRNGFARNANGKCIPVQNCPPRQCPTDPNAIVVPCGDPCPLTCDNKDDNSRMFCPKICLINGCKCKDGFVLDENKICIPADSCPPKQCPTDPNAIVLPCGDPCPLTCANKDDNSPRPCAAICLVNGCKCKEGFVQAENKTCIPADSCPPVQCPTDPNAIVVPCGDPCPLTCDNINETSPIPCIRICIVNGCKCKRGFVLGKNNTCVASSSCCHLPFPDDNDDENIK